MLCLSQLPLILALVIVSQRGTKATTFMGAIPLGVTPQSTFSSRSGHTRHLLRHLLSRQLLYRPEYQLFQHQQARSYALQHSELKHKQAMPVVTRDDIDTTIYTSNKAYGGVSGGKFKEVGDSRGATISSIQGWEGSWQLRGLKVTFSDGKTCMFGEAAETPTDIYHFEDGETLVDLKFHNSAQKYKDGNYRSGGFYFKTSKGHEFSAKCKRDPLDEYYEDVGSGVLCGVFGGGGADIDCLGFAMLRPVKSAVLINVKYPGLDTLPVATKPSNVDHIDYSNKTSDPQQLALKGDTKVTKEASWSVTTSMEFGVSVSVSASVPFVSKVNTEAHWSVGVSGTYERKNTTEKTESYDFPITCPPQKRIVADAVVYEDKISTKYEADVTYNLNSGKVIKYHVAGVYDGVSVQGVVANIQELPLPNGD